MWRPNFFEMVLNLFRMIPARRWRQRARRTRVANSCHEHIEGHESSEQGLMPSAIPTDNPPIGGPDLAAPGFLVCTAPSRPGFLMNATHGRRIPLATRALCGPKLC